MDTFYTIKEISRTTGLKEQFIRRCIMESAGKFDKYIVSRGKNNTIHFDSNAMVLFDKIKQKKENGQVIPDIISWLFHENMSETSIETKNNQNETSLDKNILKSFEEMYKQVILAKDETIKTKDEHIKSLESKILLLTDGREPQVVKMEYQKKQEDFIKMEYSLKENSSKLLEQNEKNVLLEKQISDSKNTLSNHEKKITESENIKISIQSELESKKLEIEKLKKEQSEKELIKIKLDAELKEKEDKKTTILKEIETLEGKWFVGAKRKELFNKLQSII